MHFPLWVCMNLHSSRQQRVIMGFCRITARRRVDRHTVTENILAAPRCTNLYELNLR